MAPDDAVAWNLDVTTTPKRALLQSSLVSIGSGGPSIDADTPQRRLRR
jgi:hypothetical protein